MSLTLAEIARRPARYYHLCALFNVQDRDEDTDYTKEDWAAYIERTNDEAERRGREEAWR